MIKSAVHVRHNRYGQVFDEGKAYPQVIRENVLNLYNGGLTQREISRDAHVSVGFVNKVVSEYTEHNFSIPRKSLSGRKKSPVFEDIVSYIEVEKLNNPSMYSYELQTRLLLDGVCMPNEIPAKSTINQHLRKDLKMTKKKITQIPSESIQGPNIDRQNEFLAEISGINPLTVHFFDETSVIKTEGNRRYGNAPIGERALEYQKYASNATFTVNLLQSALRVDHYNILDGPSNGGEMLMFFDDALTLENPDGTAVLERGDTVVMDNCGFHHGRFAEGMLSDMFDEFGINLLFQPPYCPHLNTRELCFNQLKRFLCRFPNFSKEEPRIAIAEGIGEITQQNCIAYFKHCGYLV